MNDDTGGRRPRLRPLVVVAGIALATAACTAAPSAPQVASLGKTSGTTAGSSGSAVPNGGATAALDQWASCMRVHGDPGQTDPTIDADKDIEITMPDQVSQTLSAQAHDSAGPCGHYLIVAQDALGYTTPVQPSESEQLKYAECMRAHGVPKYPDPVAGSTDTNLLGIGMSPTSRVFLKADDLCSKENGMHPADAPPPPGVVQVESAGVGSPGRKLPANATPNANG